MSTSYRGTHPVVEESRWPRSVPAPEHSRHRSSISSPSVFFSGEQVRQRRRGMSSSASSHRSWPRYGAVPMRRCPDCPRTTPLKRLVTSTDKNGNIGREFVKCESKPEPGKVRSECSERQFLAFSFEISCISSNLGFRVHLCDFRNCQNVGILSGLMSTSSELGWR